MFSRHIETPGRLRDQKLAGLRGRVEDRGAAVLHGMAASRIALIGGTAGIGGDDRQRLEGNIEFFGGDLLKGSLEALTEFGFAGEHRDAAIGVDTNPGVEKWRFLEAADPLGRMRRSRRGLVLRKSIRQREADDQCAAAREHLTAVE